MTIEVSDDVRWRSVLRRDALADGGFVYGVRTTGICCRPSCGAKRPNRQNVVFFRDVAAAGSAGFRPCRRCHPERDVAAERRQLVTTICRELDREPAPSFAAIALRQGLTVVTARRLFQALLGTTPTGWRAARRAERVRARLSAGDRVTEAMHAVGYSSSSRLHAAAQRFGMTPSCVRSKGRGERIVYAVASCSLGRALIAATERGLCAVLLGDDDAPLLADLERRFRNAELSPGGREFERTVQQVLTVVDGRGVDPGLPFDLRGTAFQQLVWQELRRVPDGATVCYAELARRIGRPSAVRAVARAIADNPLAVLVPCHRVLGKDGSLRGYRWGPERKRRLLDREVPGAG